MSAIVVGYKDNILVSFLVWLRKKLGLGLCWWSSRSNLQQKCYQHLVKGKDSEKATT